MAASVSVASFLGLPAELRNQIYIEVFDRPTSTSVNRSKRPPSENLQLLLACRQVYNEASLLAFSLTEFATSCPATCDLFPRLSTLQPPQIESVRSILLTAKISQLRVMHESWLGYPFGVADLNLDSLAIIPHCPDTHYDAYAEVANLSQSHTLAHILAETLAKPRYGLKQVKRILVLNDNSFSEDLFQLVYRSTVYRLWKRGDSGMRFYEYEGGKGFEVVLEGLDDRKLRTIDEEIKRLIKTPD